MKNKKPLMFFAMSFVMSAVFLLSGCFSFYDTFLAVVPTDQPFYSTLTYSARNDNDNYNYEYNFTVVRKTATVAGEQKEVIYCAYNYDDNINDYYDSEGILDFVAGKSFYLDGDEWKEDVSSLWTQWSMYYGQMGKSGTYVEFMTGPIENRHFPKRLKTAETADYLEYTFKFDEETFRISNNPYHVLLYYHMNTGELLINQNATLVFGEPNFVIPHLDTITADMLA